MNFDLSSTEIFSGSSGHRNPVRCYRPAVVLCDPPADGNSHSGACVCASTMQPLKKGKDALGILLTEADAVILNGFRLADWRF